MTSENRIVRALAPALLFLAAICGPALAAPSGDADLRELSRYTLTTADLQKLAAVNANLAKLAKAHENDDEGDDDGSDTNNESLDQMAARLARNPEARKAIEAAGLTPRQYSVIMMALFQASFAQYAVEQGADAAKVAHDASVNPANIRFVKEHKAELQKLQEPAESE